LILFNKLILIEDIPLLFSTALLGHAEVKILSANPYFVTKAMVNNQQ